MAEPSSAYDLTLPELTVWLAEQGEPGYRARQIFDGLYKQGVKAMEEFTQLPIGLRGILARRFPLRPLVPVQHRVAEEGTQKWLSRLPDGQLIETVLIPADSRRTLCVSTQVGCAYSCAFCASGLDGFKRDLTAGEIVQQVVLANESLRPERVSHVVFMGMGEPLSNYDNVLRAIRILNSPEGLKIGARRMTISTVGLVPMMERLAQEGLQVELSVSLHAPNDRLRGQIMPVNRKYPVAQLVEACRAYAKKTKRLITFEYILMDQVNDGPEQARELARLLKGLPCKVNLIPCHPIPGVPFQRPPQRRMLAFERALRKSKIACTLRKSRGLEIEGACGQLRLRQLEGAKPAAVE